MGKAFAEIAWEQVQLDAAKAWANLDIAVEMVENNKSELTKEQYSEIRAKIDEQQKLIQDTLLRGKVDYDAWLKTQEEGKDVQRDGSAEPGTSVAAE